MRVAKICKEIGCKMKVWSGGMCKNHIPKTTLKASVKRYNGDEILRMQEFFLGIWKIKPHKSEVSGVYLGKEALSTYFHHILPKEKYPEVCLDPENIILLTLDEHTNLESDMYRYEEVNKRRTILLKKYGKL